MAYASQSSINLKVAEELLGARVDSLMASSASRSPLCIVDKGEVIQ